MSEESNSKGIESVEGERELSGLLPRSSVPSSCLNVAISYEAHKSVIHPLKSSMIPFLHKR